ncbi:TlyA family RNA methyltransferase [Acanthopleuribacter pedis]|uniref:TlyA family RNA methyltransferase n=1 Tax=Acanthopleuribacter pedis TaxID=442870 RepID=A0A8J7QKP2_9BACT|nr:TlyA family RNA methyltransferase [Acanthopleuribacter pedis]MBO1319988.1 TlyA family RNA methyltransferase [Acanthopleuribacter pedis]
MKSKKKTKKKQQRVDQLLVTRALAEDTQQATRLLMSGQVLVNDTPVTKAGQKVPADASIRLRGKSHDYVGRGGLKLAAALDHWSVALDQVVALDLGSSTGGFTDCMLRRGARRVYAVDVGSNQLDYRLRRDERVVVLEQTHAKNLTKTLVPEPIAFLCADVSFTSLKYVLPFVFPLTAAGVRAMLLFKPQFELPREKIGEGGIVTDTAAVETACTEMAAWLEGVGHVVLGQIKSPVKGREGNQEFWFYTEQRI